MNFFDDGADEYDSEDQLGKDNHGYTVKLSLSRYNVGR